VSLPHALDRHLRELLASGRVRSVVGPAAGRGPRPRAHFARAPDEVETFVLSPLARANVLVHLTSAEIRRDPSCLPVAVLARGCETRMLNQIFNEGGLSRDDVHVVGLGNCRGTIDPRRLCEHLPELDAFPSIREEDDQFVLSWPPQREARIARSEILAERCRRCTVHQPLVHDHLVLLVADDDWIEPEPPAAMAAVDTIEAMAPAERWRFWRGQFEQCIRCHACRDACPLCYCEDCILERLRPRWVHRRVDLAENTAYQLQRILDLAGRCTACGECAEACPVGLPLHLLTQKVERDVRDLYGATSGATADQKNVLATFHPDDPEESIR